MKYFVSSDIHGFFDEWQSALNEKGFDLNNPEHNRGLHKLYAYY